MISRIWHGWTAHENADSYQSLLEREILAGITDRRIIGYKGAHLLRRDLETEVEFITILWFETMEAVREFAGEDYDVSVVPPRARALLSRFDDRSQHYKTLIEPQAR